MTALVRWPQLAVAPAPSVLLGIVLALAAATASGVQSSEPTTPQVDGAFFAAAAPDLGFAVTDFETASALVVVVAGPGGPN